MQVDDRRAGLEVRLTEGPYRFGREMRTMFFLANTRASQSASFNCAPLARSPALSSPSRWPMPSPSMSKVQSTSSSSASKAWTLSSAIVRRRLRVKRRL